MSKADDEHRAYVRSLPVLRLTPQQFVDLLDYSGTYPTGTTAGKRWRRLDGQFDHRWRAAGGKPRWIVGEYDPSGSQDGRTIKINWYRPVICVRARTEWGYVG